MADHKAHAGLSSYNHQDAVKQRLNYDRVRCCLIVWGDYGDLQGEYRVQLALDSFFGIKSSIWTIPDNVNAHSSLRSQMRMLKNTAKSQNELLLFYYADHVGPRMNSSGAFHAGSTIDWITFMTRELTDCAQDVLLILDCNCHGADLRPQSEGGRSLIVTASYRSTSNPRSFTDCIMERLEDLEEPCSLGQIFNRFYWRQKFPCDPIMYCSGSDMVSNIWLAPAPGSSFSYRQENSEAPQGHDLSTAEAALALLNLKGEPQSFEEHSAAGNVPEYNQEYHTRSRPTPPTFEELSAGHEFNFRPSGASRAAPGSQVEHNESERPSPTPLSRLRGASRFGAPPTIGRVDEQCGSAYDSHGATPRDAHNSQRRRCGGLELAEPPSEDIKQLLAQYRQMFPRVMTFNIRGGGNVVPQNIQKPSPCCTTGPAPPPPPGISPAHDELNGLEQKLQSFGPECKKFIFAPVKKELDYKRLSETILTQVLLKADAVETNGDESARARRKKLVRDTQDVLDFLDCALRGDLDYDRED